MDPEQAAIQDELRATRAELRHEFAQARVERVLLVAYGAILRERAQTLRDKANQLRMTTRTILAIAHQVCQSHLQQMADSRSVVPQPGKPCTPHSLVYGKQLCQRAR
jgi:hypothetical protein